MTTFRERVDQAIEARQSLDAPGFRRLSEVADEADRAYWNRQRLLDDAIADWRSGRRRVRSSSIPRRTTAAVLAATAAGIAVGWLTVFSPRTPEEPTVTTAVPTAEVIAATETTDEPSSSADLAVLQASAGSQQFAEAAQTAERLAYAFEPVGERVGTVVRFLVDAVPGSDVFAM